MQILLLKAVKGLGQAQQVVTVSDGHARNYLIPRGLAVVATAAVQARAAAQQVRQTKLAAQQTAQENQAAARLNGAQLTIEAAASPAGHLYAALKPTHLAKIVSEKVGIPVATQAFPKDLAIKTLGIHKVPLAFHGKTSTIALEVKTQSNGKGK